MITRLTHAAAFSAMLTFGAAAETATTTGPKEPNITVVSTGGAEINQRENTMTYIRDVVFEHPAQGLRITCDRLEVVREEPPPRALPPTLEEEAASDAPPPSPPEPAAQRIKQATATGNVVIVNTDEEEGVRRVARSQKAVFNGDNEEIHLLGWPVLDIGNMIFEATQEDTVIVLVADGNHRFMGPIRTVAQPPERGAGADTETN